MVSLGDGIASMLRNQNSAYTVGDSCTSSSGDAPVTQVSTSKQHIFVKIAKAEYSTAINHGAESAYRQNGCLIKQKHIMKGKLESIGLSDTEESSSSDQVSGFESKCHIKHLADDSETCDMGSSVGTMDFRLDEYGVDEQLNNQLAPQSATYCLSPQNSCYSATQYTEAKQSFTITEASKCHSSVEKSGESCEVSQSYDFVESRKVSSTYRGSTGSDLSDESSTSNLSSAMYKPHKGNDVRWVAIRKARSLHGVLHLNHFRVLKPLGCGDIGKVYLSELIGTRTYFAIKVMNKEALESRKKLLRAQSEREILQSLDHPFLPTLYTHFETENHSCLAMEYCPGGDLHSLRQRQPQKCFSEHAARFYVAEVLLALEYLHMLGVIYRDLKPENVLVREDGHIMLSDFDLSLRCTVFPTLVKSSNSSLDPKSSAYCIEPACIEPVCMIQPACFSPRFLSNKPKKAKKPKPNNEIYTQGNPLPELIAEPTNARSMLFVGTHEYLAPEIIKGEGHGSAVDWWTFGIFLHELLFGKTPFKGLSNRATLFNVVGQPLRFPESPIVSFAARDLIRGLLVKEPQHCLAYRRGATEIKQHPFFQSINWALSRCATPAEVPKAFVNSPARTADPPKASPAGTKVPGLDVKPSRNYIQIDFF